MARARRLRGHSQGPFLHLASGGAFCGPCGDSAGLQGPVLRWWKHLGMANRTNIDLESQALVRRTWKVLGVVLALVVTVMLIAVLIPMRYVGHTWSEDDVVECQSSAFVEQAARGGESAGDAAMKECVAHRRGKRWGPWGAFGNADDASKYNGADD